MFKQLDTPSKQAFVVAGLSVIEFCISLIDGIFAYAAYSSYHYKGIVDYDFNELGEREIVIESGKGYESIIRLLVFSILGIVCSILMLFGVIKKNKNLIVPWLIMALFSMWCFVGYFIYLAITDISEIDYSEKFQVLCYYCVTLYAAVTLYLQMRREETAKLSNETADETKPSDIHAHPKYNPYFLEIPLELEESQYTDHIDSPYNHIYGRLPLPTRGYIPQPRSMYIGEWD